MGMACMAGKTDILKGEVCVQVCGPPPMMKAISGDKAQDKSQGPLEGILKDCGYTESQVYKF